ncbi:hypothetical protein UB32_16990, partial [Mesobacillus subterraneus]
NIWLYASIFPQLQKKGQHINSDIIKKTEQFLSFLKEKYKIHFENCLAPVPMSLSDKNFLAYNYVRLLPIHPFYCIKTFILNKNTWISFRRT